MNTPRETIIRLAIKGQLYKNEDSANYSFPKGGDRQWLESIPTDPREDIQALRLEQSGVECFSIWVSDGHVYYAYRKQLPGRGGSDCAMVVLCSDRPVSDAADMVMKLRDIFDYCVRLTSSFDIDDAFVQEKLSGFSLLPVSVPRTKTVQEGTAYRTYAGDGDLYNILANPYQSAYVRYRHILIVQRELLSQARPTIPEVTEKVKPNYIVRNSNDSSVAGGRTLLENGEAFRLCYHKPGYNEYETEGLRAGTPSKYFTLKGNEIVVKGAAEVGVRFEQEIELRVVDSNGIPVRGWDCLVDNNNGSYRSCKSSTRTGCITLTEDVAKCRVVANGFSPKNIMIDTREGKLLFSVTLEEKGNEKLLHLVPAWGNPFKRYSSLIPPVHASFSSMDPFYLKYRDIIGPKKFFYVSRFKPILIALPAAMVTLVLGFFLGTWMGGSNSDTALVDEEDGIEKVDLQFLNANPVWAENVLNSQKYKSFFDSVLCYPEKISEHLEITNKEWRHFRDLEDSQKSEFESRCKLLQKCYSQKRIDWEIINMTEQDREEKDINYLVGDSIWRKDKLLSKKYQSFFDDFSQDPRSAASKNPELKSNKSFAKLSSLSILAQRTVVSQIKSQITSKGTLEWKMIYWPQEETRPEPPKTPKDSQSQQKKNVRDNR